MAKIFPGMDPYLEHPSLWPGLGTELVVAMAAALQPRLRPRYIAAVEVRQYVDRSIPERFSMVPAHREAGVSCEVDDDAPVIVRAAPGVEVNESYLTILDRFSGLKVVTVIELLSPSNKRRGPGRTLYKQKQRDVLRSDAHLVELDLLRKGRHTVAVPKGLAECRGPYDSLICVSRVRRPRVEFELYPRSLRRPLPTVSIPLADPDPDLRLDLNPVFSHTYEAGSYRDRIDHSRPCVPALSPEDQAWANDLVRQAVGPPEGR